MKKLNTTVRFSIMFLLFSNYSNAQTSQNKGTYILPSPTAMTFQKYGDYPVDMSTGVPQISVPLYTINLKDYSFPISASFHASGRTPALNFSPLGMNWALMASGMISREVRGRVDGTVSSHLEKSASQLLPQSQHYDDISSIDPDNNSGTAKDNEYDIYTISINDLSASFIMRDDGSIVFLNYFPYKVEYSSGNFLVTDDSGNKYQFGSDGAGNGSFELHFGGVSYTSAWYIASITTKSGSSIKFMYDNQSIQPATFLGTRFYTDQLEIQDADYFNYRSRYNDVTGEPLFNSNYSRNNAIKPSNSSSGDDYSLVYLKEINFDNGKISFSYTSTTANFLLNKCTVTNLGSKVIKQVQFDYFTRLPGTDLILQNNNSVTIKNISFQDVKGNVVERYGFDYYPGTLGDDQQSFSKRKDWWGYCNTSYKAKQIPIESVTIEHNSEPTGEYNTGGGISCKTPSFAAKLVGMIKAIHYPTGGSTVFTYEPNTYSDQGGNAVDGPGIRIYQIVSHDGFGNKTGKVYEYSGGYLLKNPSIYDYFTEIEE